MLSRNGLCQETCPPDKPGFKRVWLLYDDGPTAGRVESALVLDDVELPVGVEVAAEIDSAQFDDGSCKRSTRWHKRWLAPVRATFFPWKNELVTAGSSWSTFLNLATGVLTGLFSAALLLIAMVLYPVAYAVFTVLYALYGTILYVTGSGTCTSSELRRGNAGQEIRCQSRHLRSLGTDLRGGNRFLRHPASWAAAGNRWE